MHSTEATRDKTWTLVLKNLCITQEQAKDGRWETKMKEVCRQTEEKGKGQQSDQVTKGKQSRDIFSKIKGTLLISLISQGSHEHNWREI
jgi:hypothetical protein